MTIQQRTGQNTTDVVAKGVRALRVVKAVWGTSWVQFGDDPSSTGDRVVIYGRTSYKFKQPTTVYAKSDCILEFTTNEDEQLDPVGAESPLVDSSGRLIVTGLGANGEVRTTPYSSVNVFSVDPASGTLGASGTTRIELGTQPTSYQRLALRLKCVTGALASVQLVRSFDGTNWQVVTLGVAMVAGDFQNFDVGPGIGAIPVNVAGIQWGLELQATGAGATYTYASAGST